MVILALIRRFSIYGELVFSTQTPYSFVVLEVLLQGVIGDLDVERR